VRPAVVYGLLHAGLAVVRSLGRAGIPVEGIARQRYEFGLRSRYLRRRTVAADDDAVLEAIRLAAVQGERPVLFLERDENVDTVLGRWDEVHEIADVPLPDDPEAVRRLRRKDLLPEVAAEAGVPSPYTIRADSAEAILEAHLQPPLLVKPLEGQEFAAALGEKAVPAATVEEAVAAWKRARDKGFETVVQELVPDSHEQVYSLFTYVGREGSPLASVVGRKVRQGPLRFGTSAVFTAAHDQDVHDLGLRVLAAVDYRGLAHVEFVRDPRDGLLKVIEVNTRPPVWAGIATGPELGIAKVAYDDLSGRPTESKTMREQLTWIYLAKDVFVSAQMARRGELPPREFLRHYLQRKKVRATFAADDPAPAVASLGYLRSRV
jgi:predicted ATP-grasp superfamily ATP-dependent carboligase